MAPAHSTSGNSAGHHPGLPTAHAKAQGFDLEGITFSFALDQSQAQRSLRDQLSKRARQTVPRVHESEYLVETSLQQVPVGTGGRSVERAIRCAARWLQDRNRCCAPPASASASAERGRNANRRGL